MKTSRVAVALLIALTPCTLAAPAAAQAPGAEDPITASARARFKEGVDFYDKGEYDQARASFLQAYALKKHPAVLLNLAWSCLKSGHSLEGKKYFEQFLAESTNITDKQRADANDGLTQARGKLARIEIQATSGTDVTIDGDHIGTAPLSDAVVVEAGAHTVKFKGPDGSSDTQSVSVLGGQKAVAHFPQTASGATVAPVPTGAPASPTPDTSSTPAPSTPPADATPAPEPPKHDTTGSGASNLLTPPDNIIPVVILGVVGVGGLATGIIMGVVKGTAQNNANDLGNKIAAAPGGPAGNPGAYNQYLSDLNDVNTDATVANVGLGVGIAALVGGALYWGLATKTPKGSALLQVPQVTPMIGRSTSGLSLSGSF
jgi:hypothetical protein